MQTIARTKPKIEMNAKTELFDQMFEFYQRGMCTLEEMYMNLDITYEGKTEREMRKDLAPIVGDHLVMYITGFYLVYAYKKYQDGRDMGDVIKSALSKRKRDLEDRRSTRMNHRFNKLSGEI